MSKNQSQEEQEKNKQDESQNGIDGNYDLDEFKIDEQLVDTDSDKQNTETIAQKINTNTNNKDYKTFNKPI